MCGRFGGGGRWRCGREVEVAEMLGEGDTEGGGEG